MLKQFVFPVSLSLLAAAAVPPVSAQKLPTMQEQKWLGFLSGYEQRNFQFGVGTNGQCELFLMKNRKQRASHTKTVKIYPEVVVEAANGKRYTKRLKGDEGLSTQVKPGLGHEEVTYTAETAGDAKVQVSVKYEGDRVILDGKVLDRGKLKDGKLSFCYKILMPSFYRPATYGKDQDKAKGRMKRDRLNLTMADGKKKKKLRIYEEHDFSSADLGSGVVTEIESDQDAQEGRKIIFTTLDGKSTFLIENRYGGKKTAPWRGFYVKWQRPMDEAQGREIKPLVIEVK